MLDGYRFGLEDSTVVFYFEGVLCDGFCTSVGYNKPATAPVPCSVLDPSVEYNKPATAAVPCSVLDPSVKQQMPCVLASMMSELSVFLYSSVSEAVGSV